MLVTIQKTPFEALGRSLARGTSAEGKILIQMAGPIIGGAPNPGGHPKGVARLEPSQIEFKKARFLITDRPSNEHIQAYIEELRRHNVKDVVRVCEPSYGTAALEQAGIQVVDLEFEDGTFPPNKVVDSWFNLLNKRFKEDPDACVAVHCVAGLGRAPVLVALALIELGMKYEDAVDFIRQKRRGAVNAKQLIFLEKYRPKNKLKIKNGAKNSCTVM